MIDQPQLKNLKHNAQQDMQAYHIIDFCTILFSHVRETQWTSLEARKKKEKLYKNNVSKLRLGDLINLIQHMVIELCNFVL